MKNVFLIVHVQYDNKGNLQKYEPFDVFTSKKKAQDFTTWANKDWDPFDNESPFYEVVELTINTNDYSKLAY